MKHIPLQPDLNPEGLLDARDWDAFSTSDAGRQLRQAKGKEQHGLCGYCECRLHDETGTLPQGVSHIDHFLPRHSHPALIFDWENMILSCKKETTCGMHKDRQAISAEELLNPHRHDPRRYITFVHEPRNPSYNGFSLQASPVPDLPEEDRERSRKTIEAFNLNDPGLLDRRNKALWSEKEAIDSLAGLLDEQGVSAMVSELMEEIRKMLLELESKPFSSALLAYAKGKFHPFDTAAQA